MKAIWKNLKGVKEKEKRTYSDCWLLDSTPSNHVCCKKEWFDTYDGCGDEVMKLANGDCLDIVGKGTVKIKMYNGCVWTFGDVRYVSALGRNSISLGKLNALGYGYSPRYGVMQVCRGSLKMMKGKKTSSNFY